MAYGADPSQWTTFDLVLGLGSDLLPVVSNPHAEISDYSSLKAIGKTPSVYNKQGEVVGIKDWTSHQASDADIRRWSKQPDYGICIQTRRLRAFDIDVDDEEKAGAIEAAICAALGRQLPARRRGNSGKRLLACVIEGEIPKRVMRVDGGAVELLGNGQQFIAVGTHPSGTPYYWEGLTGGFPDLLPEDLEKVWSTLELAYAVEPPVQARLTNRQREVDRLVDDPVADWLEARGMVLEETQRGALVVRCPWEGEHTGGAEGDGSTVWFRAGTNGYDIGHFRCLHAHCEGRSRGDYLAAVDYREDVTGEFEVIKAEPGDTEKKPLPAFDREKSGAIKATINNVSMALSRPDFCGYAIGYDAFRDEIMHGPGGNDGWERFLDVDYTRLRIRLETKGFNPIGREMIRDAVELVARRQIFDSATMWLEKKVPAWDGVPRVEAFLSSFWGVEDTAYARSVSRYIWTALAGRVLEPGCKADMVPIFVGPQGCGKSTAVALLAPGEDFFAEVSFHEKEDDLARKIKGRLVIELGELRGLHTRELEAIKAWITRRVEQWVPKYKEFATHYARRCIFFGTTNQDQFLADATGNRRWLPVEVGRIDRDGIEAAAVQLWAEGREMFRQGGVDFGAEDLAGEAHEKHTMTDPWAEAIGRWLVTESDLGGGSPADRAWLTLSEVAEGALGLDIRKSTGRADQMRVGDILRVRFKYVRERRTIEGARNYVYVKLPHLGEQVGQKVRTEK